MTSFNRRTLLTATAASAGMLAPHAEASSRPPLTPHAEEGPFYLPGAPARSDLAEDRQGVPVEIHFRVLDETGAPCAGALVDVWHCDAIGRYSGFEEGPEQPHEHAKPERWFLRGVQTSGEDGSTIFRTVYPGWYPGRTPHIHFKVWQTGVTRLTSQLFLPDALSEFVYTQAGAYARERPRDTLNRTDVIAISAANRTAAAVAEAQAAYTVGLAVVVDRMARPVAEERPGGGFHPGGPPPPGHRLGAPPYGARPGLPPNSGGGPPFGPPQRSVLTRAERLNLLLPAKPA